MFQDKVTMFLFDEANLWYPVVLDGCEMQLTKGISIKSRGVNNEDTVLLMVPYDQNSGMVCGKQFIGAKKWTACPEKEGYITFKERDFFILGTYEGTPVADDGYPEGFFEYMKQNHDDVYVICSVTKFKLLPHFEIGGR